MNIEESESRFNAIFLSKHADGYEHLRDKISVSRDGFNYVIDIGDEFHDIYVMTIGLDDEGKEYDITTYSWRVNKLTKEVYFV